MGVKTAAEILILKKGSVVLFSPMKRLVLSAGAVRARFAENSGKVFSELCRFSAVRRLRREPRAEEGIWMLFRMS